MLLFIVKCYFYHFQHIGYKNTMNKKNYENSFAESAKKWNSREYTGIHSMNIVNNNILNTCNFVLITMYQHFTMTDCHKNQFLKFPVFLPTKLEYNFPDQINTKMKDLVARSIRPKSLLFHKLTVSFFVMFFYKYAGFNSLESDNSPFLLTKLKILEIIVTGSASSNVQ